LLAEPGRSTAETGSALTQCELQAENGLLEIEDACGEFEAATGAAAEADPVRSLWAEIETVEAELAKVEKAARQSEARALVAKGACDTAESEIAALRQPDGKVRWRDRGALKEAQSRLDTSRPGYEQLLAAAVEARRIASAFRRDTEAAIADLSASAPLSRDEIKRRDTAAAQAEIRVRELEQAQFATLNRPWLVADPFRHCGITTLAEATSHSACLVLDTQHRFGPQVMRLANLVAYDGLLKAGRAVRSHGDDDPEIVLVDTDGLHELAEVRRVSRNAGWWAAGLLLARALVELHHEYGETTGVVTPHSVQADATLEALRDMEPGGRPLAEVGTAHRFQGREFPVVVFDTVEPWHDGGLWMGQASRRPGSSAWQQSGVRLFNVATTRVQHRLYVIVSRERVRNAKPGTALGHLGALLRDKQVRSVPATSLITPPEWEPSNLGPEGMRLAEVLARHVTIADIHDELSFYEQFAHLISEAQSSIWLWSAWVASRVRTLLPLLQAAVGRGVRVTVFVRDPSDPLQQKEHFAEALAALRAVVPDVIEVNVTHEKVVVIDEHTVMMGSLNALSQQRSREVMITMRGYHWARKLLSHLHAEEFSKPPRCGACNGQQVDLRRAGSSGNWYWHCYNKACPERGIGKYKAWTREVTLRQPRR